MVKPEHRGHPFLGELNYREAVESETTAVSGLPLEGYRFGVTSDRRSSELIEALERRGGTVVHAPALRIAPIAEDAELIAESVALFAAAPDILLITTAYGMRRWEEACDAADLQAAFAAMLDKADIYVRGPKARGALRAAGYNDAGISPDERTSTLVDTIIARGVNGKTVGMQLHGYADLGEMAKLAEAGARVVTVSPYRWVKPDEEDTRLIRLINATCSGEIDFLTFTSAPAVDAFFSCAGELGLEQALIAALRTSIITATVGPVTAAPLVELGIKPLVPERFRMGAMLRQIVEFAETNVLAVSTAVGEVVIRGRTVSLGGDHALLTQSQLHLFRTIATAKGDVVMRSALTQLLPDGSSDHALDMAISRLRQALPGENVVLTVIKRGYRLNV